MPRFIYVVACCLLTVSCGRSPSSQTIPDPPPPQIAVSESDPLLIVISNHGPADSGWTEDPDHMPDENGRWAWYVRVDGVDYLCTSGFFPSEPTAGSVHLVGDLKDGPAWTPGTYHVSYVLKDLAVVRRDDPTIRRVIPEFESNFVQIIVPGEGT